MIAIRSVHCPVDFSPATHRQLDLAVEVCRAFGARLVVHHNVTDVAVGAAVGWMWHADHAAFSAPTVDSQLRELVARVPAEVNVETCITRGAVTEAVMKVSEAAEADLIVLSAHTGKTEDHASIIEYLLEHSNRAVLALHDPDADLSAPRFASADGELWRQTVLVPTSLHGDAHAQVDAARDLARVLPLRLHLLHVVETEPERRGLDLEAARERLQSLIPEDLAGKASVEVRIGDAVPEIVKAATELRAACIVMGEHTRVPVKRWFSHDTARAVLHEAACPVWYVPAAKPAAMSFSRFALSDEKSSLWGNV